MSSPFKTIEEFNGAVDGPTEGAIYTFAHTPIVNTLALLAAVGIFVWFIIKTYDTRSKPTKIERSLDHLSSFIVIGLLSLLAIEGRPTIRPDVQRETIVQVVSHGSPVTVSRRMAPLGFLGMVGLSLPTFHLSRKKRSNRSLNSKYKPQKER